MLIRLLHFADLHIGMENYGKLDPVLGISSRVRDFLDRLDEVKQYAREHGADLVVFAGDAYKTCDYDKNFYAAVGFAEGEALKEKRKKGSEALFGE